MVHLLILNTLFIIVLNSGLGYAQGQIGYRDYYTARLDPGTKNYLRLVESAHTNKVLEWLRDGKVQAAVAELTYTLNAFPNHPKALTLLGSVAGLAGVPAMAIPYYERALRLYPQYAMTHAQFGAYLVNIGRSEVGIAKLKKAIQMDPKLAPAYGWLAEAYSQVGQPELARQTAEQAKQLGYRGKLPGEVQRNKPK